MRIVSKSGRKKAVLLHRISKTESGDFYLLTAKVLATCVHVNGRSNQSQAQNFSHYANTN